MEPLPPVPHPSDLRRGVHLRVAYDEDPTRLSRLQNSPVGREEYTGIVPEASVAEAIEVLGACVVRPKRVEWEMTLEKREAEARVERSDTHGTSQH